MTQRGVIVVASLIVCGVAAIEAIIGFAQHDAWNVSIAALLLALSEIGLRVSLPDVEAQ